MTVWFFSVVTCAALVIGWRLKDYHLITPQHGLGYALGIAGTAAMVLLLFYPIIKRMKALSFLGSVKGWFRFHMMLGIIGPVLILYHANFHVGAVNSNVALACMLVVSGSGIIGRYIYSRIHNGLYGERANLMELRKALETRAADGGAPWMSLPGVQDELNAFIREAMVPSSGFAASVSRVFGVRWLAYGTLKRLGKMASAQDSVRRRELKRGAAEVVRLGVNVAQFNLYERLFALWHMLHLPLVFILGFAVVLHVTAVNRY